MCDGLLLRLVILSDTQSVRLSWTWDRPVAETPSYRTQRSKETNMYASGRIRNLNPSKRVPLTGLHLTPYIS